jgi:hypothetical protein
MTQASADSPPSELIFLREGLKQNANELFSSIVRCLRPLWKPLSKTSDNDRSAQRAV